MTSWVLTEGRIGRIICPTVPPGNCTFVCEFAFCRNDSFIALTVALFAPSSYSYHIHTLVLCGFELNARIIIVPIGAAFDSAIIYPVLALCHLQLYLHYRVPTSLPIC